MNRLLALAEEVRKNSYSPYSKFKVGAAILVLDNLGDEKVILGTNVENAAYGESICAERSALVSLISQGYDPKKVTTIAIVADSKNIASPCGSCRQVMVELLRPEVDILLKNLSGDFLNIKVKDLLPHSFSSKDLKNV